MSDIDYLNQIAKDNRLAKKGKQGGKGLSFDANVIKFLVGAVVAIIFVIILGSVLGNHGDKERDAVDRAYARATSLIQIVDEYNDKAKSSNLRSMAKSLESVLVETKSNLTLLLESEYGAKDPEEPLNSAITDEETAHYSEVFNAVREGWLNGFIDRHYSRELTKEIKLLMVIESEVIERTTKNSVSTMMDKSKSNLDLLYKQFDDFSTNGDSKVSS